MAHAVTSPPMLRLKRSTQSGEKLMTAAYAQVYYEDCPQAFFFCGARLDLTNMAAGDTIDVQCLAKLTEDSTLTLVDSISYSDARPATRQIVTIGYLANIWGIEIKMRQSAGAGYRTFVCEFYDAKRIGLL